MTPHPNHRSAPADDWQPASGDEVVRLAHAMRGRTSRRQFLKAVGGIVVGMFSIAGGWWVVRSTAREGENDFGGITCSEVAALADDMMQGRLAADKVAKVKQHLMLCPNCKPKFDKMAGMRLVGHAALDC